MGKWGGRVWVIYSIRATDVRVRIGLRTKQLGLMLTNTHGGRLTSLLVNGVVVDFYREPCATCARFKYTILTICAARIAPIHCCSALATPRRVGISSKRSRSHSCDPATKTRFRSSIGELLCVAVHGLAQTPSLHIIACRMASIKGRLWLFSVYLGRCALGR